MSNYTIFGERIEFSIAEDNFYQLQVDVWKVLREAKQSYDSWYKNQQGIVNVVNNCENFFNKTVVDELLAPLYLTLDKKYQIFGVARSEYINKCLDISALNEVCEQAIEIYNSIQEQLEEELEAREYNEEIRRSGQISFGIGDSLKNAASNVAHGVAKSGGDAGSKNRANQKKEKLYNDVFEPLREALEQSILTSANNYQNFVNQAKPDSIVSYFDREKSDAFLENAKNSSENCKDLLLKAFEYCPWNKDVYTYIFNGYIEERRNIIAISREYNVDLTDVIDGLLRLEYSDIAKNNEEEAVKSKNRIKSIMQELGVEKSIVIDEIEYDCLSRIINGLESADEAVCNRMKAEVEDYDALSKNKNEFFDMITKRIETIWAEEDGEIFDNYLMQTNILSEKEVNEGKEYVKNKGRTADAKKYLTAFEHCTQKNVGKARLYHKMNSSYFKILKYLGWGLIGVGVLLFIVQDEMYFASQVLPVIIGGVYQYWIGTLKTEWEMITVNGKVIHPVLNYTAEQYKNSCVKTAVNDLTQDGEKK